MERGKESESVNRGNSRSTASRPGRDGQRSARLNPKKKHKTTRERKKTMRWRMKVLHSRKESGGGVLELAGPDKARNAKHRRKRPGKSKGANNSSWRGTSVNLVFSKSEKSWTLRVGGYSQNTGAAPIFRVGGSSSRWLMQLHVKFVLGRCGSRPCRIGSRTKPYRGNSRKTPGNHNLMEEVAAEGGRVNSGKRDRSK